MTFRRYEGVKEKLAGRRRKGRRVKSSDGFRDRNFTKLALVVKNNLFSSFFDVKYFRNQKHKVIGESGGEEIFKSRNSRRKAP